MLKRRGANFSEMVWAAAARVGRNAPRITDEILERVFPETSQAATDEGALSMLRQGVIAAVTKTIRGSALPADQIDFDSIAPCFRSIVRDLKSKAYYVEAFGEAVPVAQLIESPELLDDARKFMRRKGIECLDEATRLDALYNAVTDTDPAPSQSEGAAA